MYNFSKVNGPLVKGACYIGLGTILALSALGLVHFWFMKYLLSLIAGYFMLAGLYYSGLYNSFINQFNSKK